MLNKTLLLLFICSNTFAQYSKETTMAVLTNNASRKWQLGTVKTMGGCIAETLIIEFKSDKTAEFQYCSNGKWQPQQVNWQLIPGSETNSWIIKFDTTLTYIQGDNKLDFGENKLTLNSRTLHKKGNILLLSKILTGNHLPAHIYEKFYSKN